MKRHISLALALAAFTLTSGSFHTACAELPNLRSVASHLVSGSATVETLPALDKGDPNDPTVDKTIERFRVSNPDGSESIEATITAKGLCGMEREPGLSVTYRRKSLGSEYSYCRKKTNYLLMQMKQDGQKEKLIEDGSWESSDKKSFFRSILVGGSKPQVRVEVKTSALSEAITKTYDLPFALVPYEKTVPQAEQIAVLKDKEIDHFKIYDLSGEDWFRISVEKTQCTMDKLPCLQLKIAHNNKGETVYITEDGVKEKKSGSKDAVIWEKTYTNKGWGPGEQYVKVLAGSKNAKVVVKTKTAGKDLIKEYPLPY